MLPKGPYGIKMEDTYIFKDLQLLSQGYGDQGGTICAASISVVFLGDRPRFPHPECEGWLQKEKRKSPIVEIIPP